MKVFYSWQSDLKNNCNRGFIKDALEQTIRELNQDLEINEPEREIELELEHSREMGIFITTSCNFCLNFKIG